MKKVVITGATSMIGFALVKQCMENGVLVYALVRKNSPKIAIFPISSFLKIVECDLDEMVNLPNLIADTIDVFYHIGWTHTDKKGRMDAILQNENITHTLDAVNAAKKLGCSSFIGAGSQSEFGRAENLISPSMPVNPEFAYAISKYAAGKLSKELCTHLGMAHIWVRIFSVYGELDNPHTMISYLIHTLLDGKQPELTKCEQKWDYLHAKDSARAFFLIGKTPKDGAVYCLGSGTTRPLYEYVTTIQNLINPNIPINFGAKKYVPNQVMNLCADITTLTSDTGFIQQISFEEGISYTLTWIKSLKYDEKGYNK
ncbi:MAG: NAD(P)-dependent oxidoreductase [Oscillospiraceae bacterium]